MDILKIEGALVAAALFACAGCTRPAEDSPRALLDRSLQAMELEASAGGLVVEARGVWSQGAERQGRSPESVDPTPFHETLAFDGVAHRVAHEYRHERYDGTTEWIRDLYAEDTRTIVVQHEGFSIRLRSPDFRIERERLWRRFPHHLVQEALRSESLRAIASEDGESRAAFELESGEELVLTFDPETHLLSRVEYVTDVQSFGDANGAWRFTSYAPVDGFGLFPRRYYVTIADRLLSDMTVENVTAEPRAWTVLFELPDGKDEPVTRELPEGEDAAARARVVSVAPGVYRVENLRLGFHPMFVELDDTVVAVDAPAGYRLMNELPAGDVAPGPSSAWLSERFLELIEETIPDKPIGYVVLTHFHNDHAGGLRAFVARGATVVGAASIESAVQALVHAPHTVAPDSLAREPKPLRFEPVEGRQTLGEGARQVEVIGVGPNPHTDAMLVVHVPHVGIVFASDLIEPAALEDFPAPAHERLDRFFVDWLDGRTLVPERVFSMHALEPATGAHLDRVRSHGETTP